MSQTVYASFADTAQAERAAGALLDYGVRNEDLSLVANEGASKHAEAGNYDTPSGSTVAEAGWRGGQVGGAGAVLDRPVSSGTAGDFTAPASTSLTDTDNDGLYRSTNSGLVDTDNDGKYAKPRDIEDAAKTGISTTTPADAAAGAAKGAGIGLGLGVLAGIAALMVPGVGLVVGSGALAAAIGGAAGATAAGAVAGGVTGYFKDQGIPDDTAKTYNDVITSGGAVLAVTLPSNKVDVATATNVLQKYNAANISNF
ncbi:MAG TPA: hypothetical protein VGK19_14420 [Capsulimonadaceae bacterium]|jgi:hypothetical protein